MAKEKYYNNIESIKKDFPKLTDKQADILETLLEDNPSQGASTVQKIIKKYPA